MGKRKTMSDKKLPPIIRPIVYVVGAIASATGLATVFHSAIEAHTRKKAMNASVRENNKAHREKRV